MSNPLVSVLLPVYNAEAYVVDAVTSMLTQTYKTLEVIVVNDGSTDSSIEKVTSLKEERIKIINNAVNLGLAASLNIAISHASGSYFARMDADDISMPTRIEQQVLTMENNRAISVLGTGLQYFGSSAYKEYFPATHELCKAKLLFNVCFGHSSIIMRREVFERDENRYNPELKQYSEDYDLYTRLVDLYQFANLQESYVRYRTFPATDKKNAEDKRRINSMAVRNGVLQAMGVSPSAEQQETHALAANISYPLDKKSLEQIAIWFDYLDEHNRVSNYFDEKALKQTLGHQFFLVAYQNVHLPIDFSRIRGFRFFRDYKIPPYLSLKRKAKQVLKIFN